MYAIHLGQVQVHLPSEKNWISFNLLVESNYSLEEFEKIYDCFLVVVCLEGFLPEG